MPAAPSRASGGRLPDFAGEAKPVSAEYCALIIVRVARTHHPFAELRDLFRSAELHDLELVELVRGPAGLIVAAPTAPAADTDPSTLYAYSELLADIAADPRADPIEAVLAEFGLHLSLAALHLLEYGDHISTLADARAAGLTGQVIDLAARDAAAAAHYLGEEHARMALAAVRLGTLAADPAALRQFAALVEVPATELATMFSLMRQSAVLFSDFANTLTSHAPVLSERAEHMSVRSTLALRDEVLGTTDRFANMAHTVASLVVHAHAATLAAAE